jgi:glycosyltransferase involved in cell wall biosynthesis
MNALSPAALTSASPPTTRKPLRLFINCAPGILTDHESNGEGLIVYSLANGLAERGNQVWVLAGRIALKSPAHPNLHAHATGSHRVPFNSFAPWEYITRAEAYLQSLMRTQTLDMVWRIYGGVTPRPMRTFGLPWVLGPIQYAWPDVDAAALALAGGKPRLGIGLGAIAGRLLSRGELAAREQAGMLLYETEPHAARMRATYGQKTLASLPLIVTLPDAVAARVAVVPPRQLRDSRTRTTLRLLFAANLYQNKRCEVFCRTVGVLRKQHGMDVKGVVLGDGPERTMLENLCRETPEIGDAVEFRGKVPNVEVYDAVGDSDFFVSTSVGEPYGRSIVEAMAMGTPPVCHRSGGPGDYVEHGRNGLLIDTMAPDAYADAIANLSREPERWAQISANAQQQARTEWTRDAVLDRLEGFFANLCDKR